MRWYMPGMMRSGVMFMTLSSVVMWLLIIGVIVAVGMFAARQSRPAEPSARQLLDQRYARGDIDEEEYQQRLRGLER
jgi:putative membrane protein